MNPGQGKYRYKVTMNLRYTYGLVFTTILGLIFIILPLNAKCAQEAKDYGEAQWGIGVTVRTAGIVYDTDDENVSSFVPMLFFTGERFFLDGTQGGVKLFQSENFRFDALGRLRFFDIPEEFQNVIQGDTIDLGFRLSYSPSEKMVASLDLLSDEGGRMHSNLQLRYSARFTSFDFWPYVNIRATGDDFNSHYYGFDRVDVDPGVEFSIGFDARYHIWRNLYAVGRFQNTWISDAASKVEWVDRDSVQELYLGVAFFNERHKPRKSTLKIGPYLRVAHGWATPSNIGEIIKGNTVTDPYNNQLTSLFYGFPLTDELFGIPLAIYLTPGFVHHWDSSVQSSIQEYVVAIKAYYTFTWPMKWRFGAAEGLSYVSDIPYVEMSEMERKGYEPSNLMNYLDFSIDVDLGDLFGSSYLKNWYLGYSIHHRSAIFESASQFGRISGGANFNTIYLQYHF